MERNKLNINNLEVAPDTNKGKFMETIYIVLQHNIETRNTSVSEAFTKKEDAQAWGNYMQDDNDDYVYIIVETPLHKECNANEILMQDKKQYHTI